MGIGRDTADKGAQRSPSGAGDYQRPCAVPRPRVFPGLALFVALCLVSFAAPAQVIDQYFPPIGTSVGGTPSDTSQAAAAGAYAPAWVRLGTFFLSPQLAESVGYDSNIDGVKNGRSGAVSYTSGGVAAKSQWSRNSLYGAISFDSSIYPSASDRNRTDWTAKLGATRDLGNDQAGFSYSHLDLVETSADIGASTIATQLIPYRVDALSATYTSPGHGRLTLVPGLDVTRYDFDNVVTPLTPQGESFRNRAALQESMTARYALADWKTLLFVVRGTEIRYTDTQPGEFTRDSNGAGLLLGLDFDTGGPFRYRALAGYQIRTYHNAAFRRLSSPIVEASLDWTPTRLVTISLLARRDIEDSETDNVGGFTYSSGRVSVAYEFRRNVIFGAHLQLQHASFQPTAFSTANTLQAQAPQTITNAGITAEWKLNRNLRLTASYEATIHRASGIGNYDENIGLLGLRFEL